MKYDPDGIKVPLFFFKKNYKKFPSDQPPDLRLQNVWVKTSLHTTSPNLGKFGKLFNFWFKSFPFSKTQVTCQPRPLLLILHSTISLSQKKSPFSKIFDDVIPCDLQFAPTPNQKFWLRLCRLTRQCFFLTLITFD